VTAIAEGPATVGTNTNLRQGPGTNFGVIMTVPGGSVVEVVRCGGEWCNVMADGRPGYMIARNLGFDIRVDNLTRSDLYVADEVFVCGTAAEISSVKSIDDRNIPCPGPMTKAIAEVYARAVRGEEDQYKDWCELAS